MWGTWHSFIHIWEHCSWTEYRNPKCNLQGRTGPLGPTPCIIRCHQWEKSSILTVGASTQMAHSEASYPRGEHLRETFPLESVIVEVKLWGQKLGDSPLNYLVTSNKNPWCVPERSETWIFSRLQQQRPFHIEGMTSWTVPRVGFVWDAYNEAITGGLSILSSTMWNRYWYLGSIIGEIVLEPSPLAPTNCKSRYSESKSHQKIITGKWMDLKGFRREIQDGPALKKRQMKQMDSEIRFMTLNCDDHAVDWGYRIMKQPLFQHLRMTRTNSCIGVW